MSDLIKEYNTFRVRATFTDDNASAVQPTSGTYRVDDVTGGVMTSVVANTSFVPNTTYYDIVIPSGVNIVLDQAHQEEIRLVTVEFLYGAGRRGVGDYEYTLKNMRRIEALLGT
jgi:hypothetical protein